MMLRSSLLFAVFVLLILPVLGGPISPSSCNNLDVSFSTTVDLLLKVNKGSTPSGVTATVTASDGHLTTVFNVPQGSSCKLVDAVHVDLVPATAGTGYGYTERPIPGRFDCKAPAATGGSQTLKCPLSAFSKLIDCCADSYRLFVHAVVECNGGKAETVFGGDTACTTRRWCYFQDVEVTRNCAQCTACDSSSGKCANVPEGNTDDTCTGNVCINLLQPGTQSCNGSGSCVATPTDTACAACKPCSNGVCTPLGKGISVEGCQENLCISELQPGVEQCDGLGGCEKVAKGATCAKCNSCSSGSCVPVPDGENEVCNEAVCVDNAPGTKQCIAGKCTAVSSGTSCLMCEKCTDGVCENVADGPAEGCNAESCVNNAPSTKKCVSGVCTDDVGAACTDCNKCEMKASSATCVFDPMSPTTETCGTCGEKCTLDTYTGLGSCQQECSLATQTCTPGATDDADVCTSCTCNANEFKKSDNPCECVANPCDACPEGSTCSEVVDSSGMTVKFICRRCDCGYCDASSNACCEANSAGVNCKPDNGATTTECKLPQFILPVTASSNANACAGEEKIDESQGQDFEDQCGCVPSRAELCTIPNTGGGCFINRAL